MTVTAPAVEPTHTEADDDLTHIFCACSPDWALCGRDVSDHEVTDEHSADDCVVCLDLEFTQCPRCGV